MSSYYDDASLMLLASGGAQKDGKVYSVKPTDGSGDFTFTRGSNLAATRVGPGPNFYIEKGRENVLLQSNSFATGWGLSNVTMTSGQSGYDGSNDAWLMTDTNSGAYGTINQSVTTGGITTFSCYAKSGTTDIFGLRPIGGSSPYVFFDLSNGTFEGAGDTANLIDWGIQDVGSGWYRCSITTSATATQVYIYIATTGGALAPSGSTIYIQDAQLELGLVASDYIESGATTGTAGILEDTPRFDYSGMVTCPSLLLEPNRTNSLFYSEYISAGVTWTTSGGMLTESNSIASPENLVNATKMTRPNGTSQAWLNNYMGGVVGENQVLSVYVKAGTASVFNITYYDSVANDMFFNYNLSTEVITAPTGSAYYVGSSIEDVGNGWYRCIAIVQTANNSGLYQIAIANNRVGAANEYLYVYGTQWESNASYPTSYIPTYGTSVTRAADDCSKTGISDLIGQTEGTLFFEGKADDYTNAVSIINTNRTTQFTLVIVKKADGTILGQVFNNGLSIIEILTPSLVSGTFKLALAYKSGDTSFYVNGTQIGTSSVAFTPSASLNELYIGSFEGPYFAYDHPVDCNQALLFKTRLSNLDLAILTGATTYNTFAEMAVALNYTVYE